MSCRSCAAYVLTHAFVTVAAQAATFTVPGSSATIQGAINLAASGDTVLVSPGTYPEAINFTGKNLALRSVGGPSVTAIAAPAMTPVVIFATGEGPGAVLDGFTITGGRPAFVNPYYGDGAGVFITLASPTISNNVIVDNFARHGGGIHVYFGSPVIVGNTFAGNHADYWGGGISLQGTSDVVIANNLIVGNEAGSGSAIGMFGGGTPRVSDNTMTGNTTFDSDCRFDGGTIWMVNRSDADIVQNIIAMNDGVCHGGVVILVPDGTRGAALVNNTIALNGGAASSGIYAEGFDAATRLVNNVVLGMPGSTALGCGTIFATSPPIMKNNVIWSSGGTAASAFCATEIGINGNISADPQLVAPSSGDYRLSPYSPAIDAGNGTDPLIPTADFAGAPRVQDGNRDGIAVIDIGAFEAPPRMALVTPVPVGTLPWLMAVAALILALAARMLARRRAAPVR